ncbi:MAG TPA: hypothetical protein VIQ04_03820 [Nitrososphaeraceae archaeon]
MTKNDVNIDEIITEDFVSLQSVFDRKRTKTSHFMLNSIFPNTSVTTTEYFVNAFLDDADFKHKIVRPIFVVFNIRKDDTKWQTIIQRLRAKKEYVLEYFAGIKDGKNIIIVVFQVPSRFSKDYLYFKAGKYSKFSEEYKKLFPQYSQNSKAQPVESNVWRVINKSDSLKKELEKYFNIESTKKIGKSLIFNNNDELWGLPELKYEIYRYKQK